MPSMRLVDNRGLVAAIGAGVVLAGLALWIASGPITRSLNKLYAALPGRFQYPDWWVKMIAAFFFVFGLVMIGIAILAGR
jgi:uncharacterized BrkB/YihY/UPF0761 family membrane protein